MTLSPNIQAALLRHESEIQAALHQAIAKIKNTATASEAIDLQPYYGQIEYHLGWVDANFTPITNNPGKLLRPTLLLLAYEAAGAWGLPTSDADYLRRALPAAASIELIHNFTLIHDDIEDGDRLRRGRETLWTVFGLPHGINTGDAVGALAHLALSEAGEVFGSETTLRMCNELARAHLTMCEGQALDFSLEGGAPASIDAYLEMTECKTAALFACAAALGARSATSDESEINRCGKIGRLFGLGFQIQDDVLGIWGSSVDTGKAVAGDLARRKKTFPIVWAIQNDPLRVGRAITSQYGKAQPADDETIAGLRAMLEACGAHRAACATADNYFESARRLALGFKPLSDFVLQWSENRI